MPKKKKTKNAASDTKTLAIQLPTEIHTRLKELAKADDRSLQSFMRRQIEAIANRQPAPVTQTVWAGPNLVVDDLGMVREQQEHAKRQQEPRERMRHPDAKEVPPKEVNCAHCGEKMPYSAAWISGGQPFHEKCHAKLIAGENLEAEFGPQFE